MQTEKHLKWSALQNNDRIALPLSGELSRNTLLPLWKEWQQRDFLSETQIAGKHIVWDLTQITRIDSAGFALLCDLIAYCRRVQQQDKTLILQNAPPQVLTLADLFGLSDWIKPFIK